MTSDIDPLQEAARLRWPWLSAKAVAEKAIQIAQAIAESRREGQPPAPENPQSSGNAERR